MVNITLIYTHLRFRGISVHQSIGLRMVVLLSLKTPLSATVLRERLSSVYMHGFTTLPFAGKQRTTLVLLSMRGLKSIILVPFCKL